MNPLMQSLGLETVEADPNHLPDGKYAGEVFKSEYVVHSNGEKVSHVVTYRVTEGQRTGATKQQWFLIGTNPQLDENKNVVGATPAMSEGQKPWYKKLWLDLGVPEAEIASSLPTRLVGTPVFFGTKTKDGYNNINFVEKREVTPVAGLGGGSPLGSL